MDPNELTFPSLLCPRLPTVGKFVQVSLVPLRHKPREDDDDDDDAAADDDSGTCFFLYLLFGFPVLHALVGRRA